MVHVMHILSVLPQGPRTNVGTSRWRDLEIYSNVCPAPYPTHHLRTVGALQAQRLSVLVCVVCVSLPLIHTDSTVVLFHSAGTHARTGGMVEGRDARHMGQHATRPLAPAVVMCVVMHVRSKT